jgi:FKBP-type peptidyl-prolyl cis-trans isomerase (trigger factor)
VAYYLDLLPGGAEVVVTEGPEALVASVNDATITRAELDAKAQEVARQYGLSPEQVSDAAFELQVLDEMINLELLLGEARAQNMTASDEEIDAELVTIVASAGGEEGMNAQLESAGISRDQLRENMRNEIMIRKLLEANTEYATVTATDEEVAAFYEEALAMAGEGAQVPPLAEVSEMARAQLVQQKSGTIIQTYLEELRGKAAIERML